MRFKRDCIHFIELKGGDGCREMCDIRSVISDCDNCSDHKSKDVINELEDKIDELENMVDELTEKLGEYE
jgi:hypothetical protein